MVCFSIHVISHLKISLTFLCCWFSLNWKWKERLLERSMFLSRSHAVGECRMAATPWDSQLLELQKCNIHKSQQLHSQMHHTLNFALNMPLIQYGLNNYIHFWVSPGRVWGVISMESTWRVDCVSKNFVPGFLLLLQLMWHLCSSPHHGQCPTNTQTRWSHSQYTVSMVEEVIPVCSLDIGF